jgi:2-oxoglutarate ferredoxin oxidoreductase subunit gamma
MSLEGYEKFADELKEDGVLIYEKDLVHPSPKPGQRQYGIPSTRFAEELGRSIVQNIVMVGFFTAVSKLVDREAMRQAVRGSVPAGTEKLNMAAFDRGFDYGAELIEPTLQEVPA